MKRSSRKGLRLLPEEQAQLQWLKEDGYGATESEIARRAIREAFERRSNERLAGVHIEVRDGRAYVMRAGQLAANWRALEGEATRVIEGAGGYITLSGIYACPPALAARVDWSAVGEYDEE